MSLVYNEFEGSNKNGTDEEIKMEKMEIKEKKSKKKTKKKKKSSSKKDEENKDTTSLKEKEQNDKYDTSMDGLEIPLLNNNINNGSLMLTELLDIDNNTNNNKEDFNTTNNNTNTNNHTLNIIENNSSFLKKKLDKVDLPKSLKSNITSRIEKSHNELHDDFKNDLLNISNKKTNINELFALNKSNSRIFLTGVEKISKENLKRLKDLKKEEQSIKRNINKINMNAKIIEDGLSLKNNLVDENIRKSQLKDMNNLKETFINKLIRINQKIEIILSEEKQTQKSKKNLNLENLDDIQEQYNLHLKEIKKEQEKNKAKFENDLKITKF